MKIMKIINKKGPIHSSTICYELNFTKQNESKGRIPLGEAGLIMKTDLGWVSTNVGKSLLALMDYQEE